MDQARLLILRSTAAAPLLFFLLCATALGQGDLSGTWLGTWQGTSGEMGTLKIVLTKQENGSLGGLVTVSSESGSYSQPIQSAALTDRTLTIKYDNPDGMLGTIVLEGKVEGRTVEGTYSFEPDGGDERIDAGTWKASQQ